MKTSRCDRFTLILLVLAVVVVAVPARAQTFSVLYNFGTHGGDPVNPGWVNVVAQGRDGNLYSTASGGINGLGAMFKITPGGTLTVPYSFDSTDESPHSGLTLGTDRQFYGSSLNGGTSGLGTVFKVTPSGTVTVLHNFAGSDGQWPWAPPIQGADGNFYGTTFQGGTNNNGTVYKITPSGRFTTIHSFDESDGILPYAPLVQGTDGNFYGTTNAGGGPGDGGTVFKITPAGKLTVLHSFGSQNLDGLQPYSALVQASDGNFYGTTSAGGSHNGGTVFRIAAAGKYTILHSINGFENEGGNPIAGLVQATDGNLYGTTVNGTIFRISPTKPYPYTVLHHFDGTHGSEPEVTLVQHTNGILYGDTLVGGTGGPCNPSCGVFYSLNVGLGPFVSLVSTSGKVGKTIQILGQGFTGTTGIAFNGIAATFKVSSDTYLTAIVPNGATTGSVTVTTPGGTLTSNKPFRVRP
jgi:uncharacterized repeat protein (TIGR03803 family)